MSLHYAIFIIMRTPEFTLDKGITLSLHYCQATRQPTNLPARPLAAQPLSADKKIHSYAYHLVSVRRHNQHVRSPIQGFSRCEGINFIPRAKQRSTFPRLSPQKHTNYITSHRPASTAAPARTGARYPTLRAKTQIPHRLENAPSLPSIRQNSTTTSASSPNTARFVI